MGQKIHPIGLRVGINKNWNSRWVTTKGLKTGQWVVEDEKIRKLFFDRYVYAKPASSSAEKINAQIVHIEIERTENADKKEISVFIHCGQPGIISGKNNDNIKVLTLEINKIVGRSWKVNINVISYINDINLSARVVAREIADAIENRVSFRNAQKQSLTRVLRSGALGIKTVVSGRLGGVEMARKEGYSKGVIPLSTLRADIDYAIEKAHTTVGIIGVKVWINRGIILDKGLNNQVVHQKRTFTNNYTHGPRGGKPQ